MKTVESPDAVVKSPEVEEQERFEKGKKAFGESYSTALMLRNFQSGWGEFSQERGQSVSVRLFRLANRAENSATSAISGGTTVDELAGKEMLKEAAELQTELAVIMRTKNIPEFPISINWLKKSLEEGDTVEVLKAAVALRVMIAAIDYTNNLLLRPADKVTETHNRLNK